MSKKIVFGKEARAKVQVGVDAMADTVKVTLGGKGRNVIIGKKFGAPQVTKDGVTVAREIELSDPIENMGAQMIIEAASITDGEAGDGTTQTAVMAQAIVREGLKVLDHKPWYKYFSKKEYVNPMDLKRGIDAGVEQVVELLKDFSTPVAHDSDKIKQIATISANGDSEIGDLIAKAMEKVSEDGAISIEEAKGTKTFVDLVDGFKFFKGWESPFFITNPARMTTEFDEPLICFISKKIASTKELLPVIDLAHQADRPLVIVADSFEGEVVFTLSQNKLKRQFRVVAVSAPSFGDKRTHTMEDLALVTGGTLIAEEKGLSLKDFTMEMFGQASKIKITERDTIIIKGMGSKALVQKKISELKEMADDAKQEWDEREIKLRIAKLSGGVAVIYAGANTEIEMKEKKDRIEDAKKATLAAVEEGIVVGGGKALLDISYLLESGKNDNKDKRRGLEILRKAIREPFKQVIRNAGENPEKIMDNELIRYEPYAGYDVNTGMVVNMVEMGIIDPKKVTRVALESAASVATLILTTEASVSVIKE